MRERPRVSIKRENCYHYREKAKKVQKRGMKILLRRNNYDGYFCATYHCSLTLSKLSMAVILWRGWYREIKQYGRPYCWDDRYQRLMLWQLSGNFLSVQANLFFWHSDAILCFSGTRAWILSQLYKPSFMYAWI